MERVVIADVGESTLSHGLDEVFSAFGGLGKVIPAGSRVYIKPNAVHFSPQAFTDARVLEALLAYLRDHGYNHLAVMENATGGNFTRLVFRAVGYTRLCRRYGAEPIYLDEGPTTKIMLRGEDEPTRIPRRLSEDLIIHREENFYLGLPKLKTHPMTTVTLGVKNQQAFPIHADRMHRHNHETLHRRLASLYDFIRPDFCIVEGLNATIHGHFPARALLRECLVALGVLIGGRDTLAVDTVAARVLGYTVEEVEHLRLCAAWGLGEADLANIEVVGAPLERFDARYPHTLLGRFHPAVRIVEGAERACIEGCKGNSTCIQEMLYNDFGGRGGWTLVYGKGVDKAALEDIPGDVLVVGPCAVGELRGWLTERYPDRRLYLVEACNDLMLNTTYQARLMGVTPVRMSPLNPLVSAFLLLQARLHRTTARVPPLLG